MGKPKGTVASAPPPPRYRDQEEGDAVSLRTTRSDYEYQHDDVPHLPSYSDSEAAISGADSTPGNLSRPPPRDEYPVIGPTSKRQSSGRPTAPQKTTIRMDERLNDPEELHGYIVNYLQVVPPKPAVCIHGYHTKTVHRNNKKETERITDFDIVFWLDAYLPPADPTGAIHGGSEFWRVNVAGNGDAMYRGGWRKTRAKGHRQDIEIGAEPAPGLQEWCNDFCRSPAKLKVFRVTREVTGLNYDLLKSEIESLVRGIGYRGHIDVTFPVEGQHVDIYNPHWIQRCRTNWARFLFYVSMLWIFTWPLLFFLTKWWSVYTVQWRFSYDIPSNVAGPGGRKHASVTELAWYQKHAGLIQALVLDKWQGDATDLPLERQSNTQRDANGRRLTGNRDVDAAVSVVQGGLDVWNALSGRGSSQGGSGWGGDE